MISYDECVDYIFNIPRNGQINDLNTTKRLLDRIYKGGTNHIIHVAGTNGKGSTSAFIDSILQNANIKVGLFTSPHLIKVNERIKVDGIDISNEEFLAAFDYVIEILRDEGLVDTTSFFEIIFLMAMYHFNANKVEYVVLETGLGGRLDQTNSITSKQLAIITKIGLDHTEYLGDTIELIASEKAGIIKENVPVVFWDNEDESSRVIKAVAKSKNSACYGVGSSNFTVNSITKEGIDFSFCNEYYNLENVCINMLGSYQLQNASLAINAVKLLKDDRITDDIIRAGILKTHWSGRMDRISPNIYVDGAHNVDGIRAFIDAVKNIPHNEGKIKLLFSVVSDKNYAEMIKLIKDCDIFDEVYVCTIESKRTLDMEALKKAFLDNGFTNVSFYMSLEDAFTVAKKSLDSSDELYVAGSLYLVGQLLETIDLGVIND